MADKVFTLYYNQEVGTFKNTNPRIETFQQLKNYCRERLVGFPLEEVAFLYYGENYKHILVRNEDLGALIGDNRLAEFEVYTKMQENEAISVEFSKDEKEFTIDNVTGETTVGDLKRMVDKELGLSPHRQILSYEGFALEDGDELRDFIRGETLVFSLEEIPMDAANTIRFVVGDGKAASNNYEHFVLEENDTVNTLRRLIKEVQPPMVEGDFQIVTATRDDPQGGSTIAECGISDGDYVWIKN